MKNTIMLLAGWLALGNAIRAQEQPRQIRADGHLLGETAEQFFSEGRIGDVLRSCQARDWKSVARLFSVAGHSSKINAKDICAALIGSRQQAVSGVRLEYNGQGDKNTLRTDTFTFDDRHLVKIDMVYEAPIADVQGFHPKSFDELLAGLEEAYGAPTKTYAEPIQNAYSVRYQAHRAIWMGEQDVISIIELPGENGWTKISAVTLAEYNRAAKAPKTQNPLH
jgi:hypothetical protein